MAKFIRSARRVEVVSYSRVFENKNCPGSGYSFSCTKTGKLIDIKPEGKANYMKCLRGEYDVIDCGIQRNSHSYTEPAVICCEHCGHHLEIPDFTNTCECGADYNGWGQRLAAREQWGCETGEHWSECI